MMTINKVGLPSSKIERFSKATKHLIFMHYNKLYLKYKAVETNNYVSWFLHVAERNYQSTSSHI